MPNTSSRTLKVRLDFLRVNRLIIRTTETTDRFDYASRSQFRRSCHSVLTLSRWPCLLYLSFISQIEWRSPRCWSKRVGDVFLAVWSTFHTSFISWAWVSIQSRSAMSCILYFFCCNLAQNGNQTQSGTCEYTGLEVLQIAAILSWTSTEWSLLSITIGLTTLLSLIFARLHFHDLKNFAKLKFREN